MKSLSLDMLLLAFFNTYCALIKLLMLLHRRAGLPARFVDLPRAFLPDALMKAAARSYFRHAEAVRSAESPNPLAAVPPFGRSSPEVAAVGSASAERSGSRPPAEQGLKKGGKQ